MMASQNSPRVPHQGHPSPALSQSQEPSTTGMASKRKELISHKQPPAPNSESRFCPIETSGTESEDTSLSRITVLPSPTPSGEAESPLVITTQLSAARTEAPATEVPATSGAVGSSTRAPASSSTRSTASAETHPATGTSTPANVGVGQHVAASQARCEQWIAQLDSFIGNREGSLGSAEKLRLEYLKAVLSVGDELCVVVHGFVVLWILDAERCAEVLRLSRAVVDSACETLGIVFGGLRSLKNDVLARLVNFPPGLRNGDLHPSSAVDVSRFFQRLASSWNGILRDHLQKWKIPLRHRELVGVLQLRSQNLRLTLFRWSLTFLGVHSMPESAYVLSRLEEKFVEDQDFYLDQSRSKVEYEVHDENVAATFRELLSASKRGPPEADSPRSGSATQTPAQGQQPCPPKQPQNQSLEQSRKRRRTQSLEEQQDNLESTQEYRRRQIQLQQQHLQQLQKLRLQSQSTQQQPVHLQHPIQSQQQQHTLQPQQQLSAHQIQQYQHQNHLYQTHPQGHSQRLLVQTQGPSDAQRRELEQRALLQEGLMRRAQQEQQLHDNYRRILIQEQQQGVHIQTHQQTQPQNPYPTPSGTWSTSPTSAVFSPIQGQPGVAQSPVYGQQPQVQGPTPVTLSMGSGRPMYQDVYMLAQAPQHGRGTAMSISNPTTPTGSFPSQHLPVEQQQQRGAPYHHVQSRPGSAVPSNQHAPVQRQQANYMDVSFALNPQNAAALRGGGRGPAPAQNHSNPQPSSQLRNPQLVYHQFVDSLLSGPTRLPTTARRIQFEFDITDNDFKRFSKYKASADGKAVLWSVSEGCRRVRFRICTKPISELERGPAFPENKWVGASPVWPKSLTVKVNEDGFVDIPQKQGAGGVTPCDIAAHLRPGRNVVSVAVLSAAPQGTEFYGAVEMLDTQTQSSIMENVSRKQSLPEAETIHLIKSRLAVDDDDVQVIDPEIYVSVTDPLSGSLVGLPCRGDTCSHLDVFDLGALLESRRPKRCPHGGTRAVCSTCTATPHSWPDVPSADTWACPICGGDARPGHLVVDEFLQGIVGNLAADAKKEGYCAQAVYVDGNGTWRAKALGKEKGEEGEVVMIDD